MIIKPFVNTDLEICSELYIDCFNKSPWNQNWELSKLKTYLTEYIMAPRFVGFVLTVDDNIVGGIFCHAKTWWTNDFFVIDELFVSPKTQGLGYGKALLSHTEKYAKDQGCEVITLLTNKHMPSMNLYSGTSYQRADHFTFLFKQL